MQVALESLGREDGGGYLPPHLVADLQRRLARPARDMQSKDVTALASTATASFNQTLRLYACVYRTALRRFGDHCHTLSQPPPPPRTP